MTDLQALLYEARTRGVNEFKNTAMQYRLDSFKGASNTDEVSEIAVFLNYEEVFIENLFTGIEEREQKLLEMTVVYLRFIQNGNTFVRNFHSLTARQHVEMIRTLYESFEEYERPNWFSNLMLEMLEDNVSTMEYKKF